MVLHDSDTRHSLEGQPVSQFNSDCLSKTPHKYVPFIIIHFNKIIYLLKLLKKGLRKILSSQTSTQVSGSKTVEQIWTLWSTTYRSICLFRVRGQNITDSGMERLYYLFKNSLIWQLTLSSRRRLICNVVTGGPWSDYFYPSRLLLVNVRHVISPF